MSARLASMFAQSFGSSPLRHARFRAFYFASIGVALGYTMQATLAAWLMATMTPSPLMVALVQTASTAPAIIVGLVAGALSDIVERRRVILATQLLFVIGTVVLGVATIFDVMAPWALLLLTAIIGIGFTFYMPAQQASINDLVERLDVPQAVALGAVAMNVSRAIGPALAGALAAWIGSGSAFLASAVFFAGMVFVVRRWPHQPPALPGVPETLITGIASGLRFVRHSTPMRAIILRNLIYSLCASSLWALLPVIARDQLGLGAGGFGLLFGSFGAGAVVGALNVTRQLRKHSLQRVVLAASLLWVISTTLVAATELTALALIGAFGAGASWVGVFASLGAGTQSAAPAWVRARAVAMSFVTVQASLALGSVVWGVLATWQGTRIALLASTTSLLVLLFVYRKVRVRLGGDKDIMPGAQLPELGLPVEPQPDDGPVLIQIEYRVDADKRNAFLRAVHAVGPVRRRNGANSWRVFRDVAEEGLFVERYIISSWAEYVRLRARMTIADRQVADDVSRYQREGVPLRVSRLLGIDLPDGRISVPAPPRD
ncbi:MAG: MFS transporter [Betaproteobacteria bacterium]